MNIAANYEITKIRVNPVGKTIEALEINGEAVSVGAASLQDNKAATIDVSTYTEPVEVTPTAGKDGMKKATITLSNIPSGADLEANKEATIDVSNYSTPVEITPTEGKDGMEKVTVTLSNIPSGGSAIAYAWKAGTSISYYDFAEAPADKTAYETHKGLTKGPLDLVIRQLEYDEITSYTKVDDDNFTVDGVAMVRSSTDDFVFW